MANFYTIVLVGLIGLTGQVFGFPSNYTGGEISVECTPGKVVVTVPLDIVRQVFPGVDPSALSFADPYCRGRVTLGTVVFSWSMIFCGATREIFENEVVFTNHIRPIVPTTPYSWRTTTPISTSTGGTIARYDGDDIEIKCHMDARAFASGNFQPIPDKIAKASGHGNYSVKMDFYYDSNFKSQITSFPLHVALKETIYVDLVYNNGNTDLPLAVRTCYATPTNDPTSPERHYLIINGCPADPTVGLDGTHYSHIRFHFGGFEFMSNKSNVFIFCEGNTCEGTRPCHPTCNRPRHRRDIQEETTVDLIRVVQGPLVFRKEKSVDSTGDQNRDENISVSATTIVAVSAVAMAIAAVAMLTVRKLRSSQVKVLVKEDMIL